jgi:hypothetical protein
MIRITEADEASLQWTQSASEKSQARAERQLMKKAQLMSLILMKRAKQVAEAAWLAAATQVKVKNLVVEDKPEEKSHHIEQDFPLLYRRGFLLLCLH